MKFTLETSYKIYDEENGSYIEICPDADGLGLIEIRDVNEKGVITNTITMPPEQAKMVNLALNLLINEDRFKS
jgi:hypothetical protein